jgi:hypothetical protein
MRRILLGLVLVCVPSLALAQGGGSPGNPLYVRKSQGTVRDQYSVSCTAGGDVALLTSAQTENALSIYCQNMQTTSTERVGICPRTATAGACDAASKFAVRLDGGAGWTTDVSSPGDWSCNGIGGTRTVNCYVERFVRQVSGAPGPNPTPGSPTPTPIPTQTVGPTPTP